MILVLAFSVASGERETITVYVIWRRDNEKKIANAVDHSCSAVCRIAKT